MTTEQTSPRVAKIAARWNARRDIVRVLITTERDGLKDWFEMKPRDFKAVMASALTQTANKSKRIPQGRTVKKARKS